MRKLVCQMRKGNYSGMALASVLVSGAVFLAGCSSSGGEDIAEPVLNTLESSPKETEPVTVTETAEAEEAKEEPGDDQREAPKECDTSPHNPEIARATEEVNRKYPNGNGGWVITRRLNYDSCSDLSYALVTQAEQGNAQFGTLILMFHQGEYIGIDSNYPQQAMEITPTGDARFTVKYKDWEALDAAGAANSESPNYTSTVTYYWDGSKVAHEGRIPNTSFSPL